MLSVDDADCSPVLFNHYACVSCLVYVPAAGDLWLLSANDHPPDLFTILLYPLCVCVCMYVCSAAGDLWLLSADDHSTLLDAVMESFRIHDRAVSSSHTAFEYAC
jgi:hypothetical protein